MSALFDRLQGMSDEDRQRAVLETFVRMHYATPELKGWTHVRAEILAGSGRAVRWRLLDADDDAMRGEKEIKFGTAADEVAQLILANLIKGQPYETARMTIKFSPATLMVDILNETNTTILSGKLIDPVLEATIHQEMLAQMKEE